MVAQVHDAHGQVHGIAHLVLGRGNGVQARRLRTEQAEELLRRQRVRVFGKEPHWRGGGQQGVQRLAVFHQFLQRTQLAQRRILFHQRGRVLCDVGVVGEGIAQRGFAAIGQFHRFRAVQFVTVQNFAHQRRSIDRPDTQCVTGLILDARAFQVDFDVLHILFGIS